jgi:hypothetical protein
MERNEAMGPQKEPVGWAGAITALAVAIIACVNTFGGNIDPDKTGALLGVLAAVMTIGTLIVRSNVTPVKKAQSLIDEAFKANPEVDEKPYLPSGLTALSKLKRRQPSKTQTASA